jgi:RNA polymerase sigma-70 factor (ECF subfamily)
MYEPQAVSLPLAIPAIERVRLMRYIERRIPNPDDADDLMQEVLKRALQAKSPQFIEDPIKYLYGIARHVICDFTKAGVDRGGVIFDSDLADSISEQSLDAVPDARAAEEALAAQIDYERAVEQAIKRLPSTHRKVLLMTMRDGLTYAQAAKTLNLSLHTIKKYAHQARAQLRILLDPSHSQEEGEQV